ncbi:MAG: nucleotidyltransferase domain-containing protein [Wenzhouxiangella sp.]|nr:nucleotidyltransferase domain-containing protein [Wenzhouxiangella sp.]
MSSAQHWARGVEGSSKMNYSSSKVNPNQPMSTLAEALFTTTQQRLFGLLYGEPDRSFYLKEILRLTGMGVATIKRELDRMVEAGILTRTHVGNQHHYQADPSCPIHAELVAIVRKTLGLADPLRAALAPLAERITWAFIFGSMARGTGVRGSDVDLMVVGDVTLDELSVALYPAQETISREINPKLYRPAEWLQLVASDDAFARNVLDNPRIDLIGAAP